MIQRLANSEWQPYFNYVSKYIPKYKTAAKIVHIEVGSNEFGSQELTQGQLEGLIYEPREDIFYVYTGDFEHLIYHPVEIYIDGNIRGLNSVQIIDEKNYEHLIMMKYPLQLPELAVRSVR